MKGRGATARHRAVRVSLIFLLVGAFAGCVHTILDGPGIGQGYAKLAALAKRELTVSLAIPSEPLRLGRQWVFLAVPAGIIETAQPRELLAAAIFRSLADHNVKPRFVGAGGDITINRFELRCSVPDLLFVRYVRCSAALSAVRRGLTGVELSGEGEAGEFKAFGFKPQLEPVLDRALMKAVNQLIFLDGSARAGS